MNCAVHFGDEQRVARMAILWPPNVPPI